jgi:eukaryotic-like serine/threonine-protein kinase
MLMDTTLSDPLVGRLLEGRYAVEAFIAHGGMASVYIATDTRLERRVAVKVLHAHLSDDPETVARFEREARAAARLSSPDVVAVYDQGNDAGRAFLVMEFVPGANLRQIVRDRGRLSTGEAVAVMDHVLAALSAAHAAGLVHRDVKPENVLITADGRVKVADFGLARAVSGSTVTTTGSVLLGTAAYLAPEQFEHGTADARSDVYSAGVLLFELLTGTTPFQADSTYALLNRHAHEDIPAPSTRASGIPPQIDALVTWATSRDPQERPADAGELHASLIDVRDRLGLHGGVPSLPVTLTTPILATTGAREVDVTQVVGGPRPPAGDPPVRPGRRRRGLFVVLLVLLLVILAGVAGWWFAAGRYTHVPSGLVGQPRSVADAKLKAAGLHEQLGKPEHSAKYQAGLVAAVSPSNRIRKGGTVTLRLSSGPVTHELPSVRGDSVSVATTALSRIQVHVSATKHQYSPVPKGEVVGTEPGAGNTVDAGSGVTLVVSKGVQMIAVPTVANLSAQQARSALINLGFLIDTKQVFNSTIASGTVISSSPNAGVSAPKGSTVTLLISKGPQLFPVPNVRGDTIQAAMQAITDAGFKPNPQQFLPGGPNRVFHYGPTGMQPHGTTIVLNYF